MSAVEKNIFDAGFDEGDDQVLLPGPCRKPHPADPVTEKLLEMIREGPDLADAVLERNHRQDRFEEPAT